MWRWAGDTATDYNYYSKRLILSGVIASTRLYWFDDDSEDFVQNPRFLERIENVMQFEKVKAQARAGQKKFTATKRRLMGLSGHWRNALSTKLGIFRAETGHMAHFAARAVLRLAVKMHISSFLRRQIAPLLNLIAQ